METNPTRLFQTPLADTKTGGDMGVSWAWKKWFQEVDLRVRKTLTLVGQIAASTIISGRTEGIGTTVQQLNATGNLLTADNIAADGATFKRITANQQTGAGRGFAALDSNNRLAGTFHNNPVNSMAVYTGASPLSATTGGAPNQATVTIGANTQQFGDGQVNYSGSSITPLSDSTTYYIYADDPTFAGGAVIYHATTNSYDVAAANGRVYFGKIATPAFGGGGTTGSGGAGGPCPLSGAPVRLYGDPAWWKKTTVPCEQFVWIHTAKRIGVFSETDLRYSRRGLLEVKHWKVGDMAVTEEGEEKVLSILYITIPGASVDKYEAEHGHIYSAWGFIGHNKPL